IARATSGSRSRINSVEPLISANSAVTVLRSPSICADSAGCPGVTGIAKSGFTAMGGDSAALAPGAASNGAAHSSQNLAVSILIAPQRRHFAANGAAHSLQNFAPSRLSFPHFVQRISYTLRLVRQFVEQDFGVFQVGGVEAFGEPAIDLGEHRARFIAIALLREQSREAHRRAQLKRFPILLS